MFHFTRGGKHIKWQKSYLNNVFKKDVKQQYSHILLNNMELLNNKDAYIPNTLYKFYSPTSDNILDLQKQRLWLAQPDSFNDPFDCRVGYDSFEYEKLCLLKFIKKNGYIKETDIQNNFTSAEYERIRKSTEDTIYYYSTHTEDYWSVKRNLLDNKSQEFKDQIQNYIYSLSPELEAKIKKLRDINIRVACFSNFKTTDDLYCKIQMWSHYAENHKGYCVEYDLSFLKNKLALSLNDSQYYVDTDKNKYLDERIKALIKGGLFPVVYTSSRVNIPFTKLKKITVDDSGKIANDNEINEIIYKSYIIKSSNWSYENEWRLILDGNICDYYGNKIPFPYIKRVYLGCKMDSKTKETIIEICNEMDVDVVSLEMDNKKFCLNEIYLSEYRSEMKKYHNPFWR